MTRINRSIQSVSRGGGDIEPSLPRRRLIDAPQQRIHPNQADSNWTPGQPLKNVELLSIDVANALFVAILPIRSTAVPIAAEVATIRRQFNSESGSCRLMISEKSAMNLEYFACR